MLEFFQFLNTCSPLRAVTYMVFIFIVLFITYAFIESIIVNIIKRDKVDDRNDTNSADGYYDGDVAKTNG